MHRRADSLRTAMLAGKLPTPVASLAPFTEVKEAPANLEARRQIGKAVLQVAQ